MVGAARLLNQFECVATLSGFRIVADDAREPVELFSGVRAVPGTGAFDTSWTRNCRPTTRIENNTAADTIGSYV
jgi:hypothetical protein